MSGAPSLSPTPYSSGYPTVLLNAEKEAPVGYDLVGSGVILNITVILLVGGGVCCILYQVKRAAQALVAGEDSDDNDDDDEEKASRSATSRTSKRSPKSSALSKEDQAVRAQLQQQLEAQEEAQHARGRALRQSFDKIPTSFSHGLAQKKKCCGGVFAACLGPSSSQRPGCLSCCRSPSASDPQLKGDALVRIASPPCPPNLPLLHPIKLSFSSECASAIFLFVLLLSFDFFTILLHAFSFPRDTITRSIFYADTLFSLLMSFSQF